MHVVFGTQTSETCIVNIDRDKAYNTVFIPVMGMNFINPDRLIINDFTNGWRLTRSIKQMYLLSSHFIVKLHISFFEWRLRTKATPIKRKSTVDWNVTMSKNIWKYWTNTYTHNCCKVFVIYVSAQSWSIKSVGISQAQKWLKK